MIPKTERLSAGVLILGGGLAGCMGAVAAIKKGCTVILADKAWVGSSGESTFAAGDILYYDPEQDDMHEWLELAVESGEDEATAKPWSSPATKCRRSSAASSKSSAWSSSTA